MTWFKPKVAEVGLPKDKDGFYIDSSEIKPLSNYKWTDFGHGVYIGTAMTCDTVMRYNTVI